MEKKTSFLKGLLTGLLSAGIIAVVILSVKIFVLDRNTTGVEKIFYKAEAIQELLEEYYLEEADIQALGDAVYKAMVESLGDKYSTYYTAEEYQTIMESVSGKYKGIGVSVSQNEEGTTVIVQVFPGSPSEDVGILPGDIIYKVEGEDVSGKDLDSIVALIKGEEGTTVNVTVLRKEEEIDFLLERRQIEIPSIYGEMLENNIGYLSIESFDDVTANQFQEEINNLEEQGMKSLIIDVRNNPGGTLDSVTQILDQILPEGLLVYTEDKEGKQESYYSDEENKLELPMVVLINENSASASEIFAGAIKDFDAATLVGKTTFGKGVMQIVRGFSDGSAVKLTNAYFYTPKGNVINNVGVKPDVEVDIPEEAIEDYVVTEEEDTQLKKALEILNK